MRFAGLFSAKKRKPVKKKRREIYPEVNFPPDSAKAPAFYSTLFSDSTISIFFSLKCIVIFTKAENPTVNKILYRKLGQ